MAIEKFEDLGFTKEDTLEQVEQKLQEKLGIKISDLQALLGTYVEKHAEELSLGFNHIAPLGNYETLLEDNDSMAQFLKTEGAKPEHWRLFMIYPSPVKPELMQFVFSCSAVDDEEFKGFVYVSKSGMVRHAFAQHEDE